MLRAILDETKVHPSVRDTIANNHSDIVKQVQAAISKNDVGMAQNVFPKKARAALKAHNVPFEYLEFGSYVSEWRRRTALKMWTGWPTFPMIFVKGTLIGGFKDLERMLESGELQKMLQN